MAALEKIRSKAGLLVITIGIALLAFIIGDLLNSGQTYFRMSQDKVAVINGETITTQEFMNRVNEMTEVYKMQTGQSSLPNDMVSQINQNVYESLVREILINTEADKIGMTVSKEELADMVQGDNISPMLQQIFRNPQTGTFDKSMLLNFLKNVVSTEEGAYGGAAAEQLAQQKAFWLFWEKNIKQQRLESKYNTLLTKAIVPNKLDVQSNFDGGEISADFAWVRESYSVIPDSTVTIASSELKKLYDARKKQFKQDEKRAIKYFIVDILPSQDDYQQAEKTITDLKADFSSGSGIADLINMNSDQPYVNAYVAVSSLSPELKKFAETAALNDVEGPFLEDRTYKMYRLMGKEMAPDSVKARHIMFPLQDLNRALELTDSLMTILKKGGDFAALAQEYSVDQNSASRGGDLGWFTEESAIRGIGEDFKNACFNAKLNEYFTVKTLYGMHIVQVTERTANVPKAKIAQMIISVDPSSQTFNDIYNEVNQFLAVNNDLAKFEAAAPEKGYRLMSNNNLTANDYAIGTIRDARNAVRWAFQAKKGEVSQIYEIDNKFLVVAVAGITPKGYTPMEQVEPMLRSELMADKKAQIILSELKGKNASTLQEYTELMKSTIDTAKFVSFNTRRISGMGDEPVLSALAPLAPENQIQGPVQGKNGIYVFSVFAKIASDRTLDVAAEKQQLQNSMLYRIMYQSMEVLKNKADIEDDRIKFF